MLSKLCCALPVALFVAHSGSAQIVINEFVYDHSSSDTDEFVELYNAGTTPVDLTGWVLDCEDDGYPSSGNFDIVIPSDVDPGPAVVAPIIPAGGYFTIVNENATIAGLLAAADYIVPRNFAAGEFLLENSGFRGNGTIDSIILRDATLPTGIAQDAVAYEAYRLTSTFVTPAYVPAPEQIEGPGIRGDQWNTRVGAGYLWSWSRIADGFDTDNNGYDFRAQPMTPGATNVAAYDVSVVPFVLDGELAASSNGTPLMNWEGTFAGPQARDYATAGIPASPSDDAGGGVPLPGSLIGQFGSVGASSSIGNTSFLLSSPQSEMAFDGYVWIDTTLTVAGEGRYWHIGMHGTAGQLFNLPMPVSSLPFNDTADVTGAGLTFLVNDTGATFSLVDYTDGSTVNVLATLPAAATPGWERIRVQVSQGVIEARIGGTPGLADGTVLSGATSGPGFGGLFIGARRQGGSAGVEAFYADSVLVTAGGASLECFGAPTANSSGDPALNATGLPYDGSTTFGFEVSNMLPSAGYSLLLGTGFPGDVGIDTSAILPTPTGLTLWVNLNLFGAPGFTDASGSATFPIPLAGVSSLFGASFWAQGFQLDTSLPFAIPYSATKAIKWTIGPF